MLAAGRSQPCVRTDMPVNMLITLGTVHVPGLHATWAA
jgi:hypothetical protein